MNKGVSAKIYNPNPENVTTDWITPPKYVEALGEFDLDPCHSLNQQFKHAKKVYTIEDDGLSKKWEGRVWLNPPYGRGIGKWLKKMKDHNNGIALIPARTDTMWFHDHVVSASGMLFLLGRIKFIGSEGYAKNSCNFPIIFVAYGEENMEAIYNARADLFMGYPVNNFEEKNDA